MRTLSCALVAATLFGASSHAELQVHSLDGTVLPSKQGWTYGALGNALTESEAFSLAKGSIKQSTLGSGFAGQGGNWYSRSVTLPQASAWTLRARVRIIESEQWTFPFASYVSFGNCGVALVSNLVSPFAGGWTSFAMDATQWHEYRIEVLACGRWTFFVDGQYLAEGLGAATQGTLEINFGDGTGGANANALYDFIELTINDGIAPDFNGDGSVNAADLALLLGSWGEPGLTDLDCSGLTDAGDIALLLGAWS